MYDIDSIDYFVETPFIGDEEDLREWGARERFDREDHHAHVLTGWMHHHATAHIEPNNHIPF